MSDSMTKIAIKELCGEHCVGVDEGRGLFEKILPILKSGGKVCLDFSGVFTITSSFLNVSIGALVGQLDIKRLETDLFYEGLEKDDEQLICLVVKNAKEHFAKSDEERSRENGIIKDGCNGEIE